MSALKRILWKLFAPIIAALASLAARYAVKKAPEIFEYVVLPRLREATEGAGGAAEKIPDLARSAMSGGGDLAERLTDRVHDVTGGSSSESGGSRSAGGNGRSRRLSQEQLSERSEDRAKRRAERRKATKRK
jgi:hypothetical protein